MVLACLRNTPTVFPKPTVTPLCCEFVCSTGSYSGQGWRYSGIDKAVEGGCGDGIHRCNGGVRYGATCPPSPRLSSLRHRNAPVDMVDPIPTHPLPPPVHQFPLKAGWHRDINFFPCALTCGMWDHSTLTTPCTPRPLPCVRQRHRSGRIRCHWLLQEGSSSGRSVRADHPRDLVRHGQRRREGPRTVLEILHGCVYCTTAASLFLFPHSRTHARTHVHPHAFKDNASVFQQPDSARLTSVLYIEPRRAVHEYGSHVGSTLSTCMLPKVSF